VYWKKWLSAGLTAVVIAVTLFMALSDGVEVKATTNYVSLSLGQNIQSPSGRGIENTYIPKPEHALSFNPFYTDELGGKYIIDNSWRAASSPYDWEMVKDDYHVRVKENIEAEQVIEFSRDNNIMTLQPASLQWSNELGIAQLISVPSTLSNTSVGFAEKEILTEVAADKTQSKVINKEGFIKWNDIFGNGVNLKWQCTPKTLEKVLEIEEFGNLPKPNRDILKGKEPYLDLTLSFTVSSGIDIVINGKAWDKVATLQTSDFIWFGQGNEMFCLFKPLRYWCSDNGLRDGESVATLSGDGRNLYISIRIPYSWLQSAVYPVFIDADVTIGVSALSVTGVRSNRGGIFWSTNLIGYVIYIDSSGDLKYRKTTDGGASWSGATNIRTGTVLTYDCYADWQVVGDAGTKIHIVYNDIDTDEVRYCYLDISSDTIGGDVEVYQETGINPSGDSLGSMSICKTRGGKFDIAVRHTDNSFVTFYLFFTSPDASTWTSKAVPWESAPTDQIELHPANLADNNDIWALFWDISANAISLKTYDDSADSWSEAAIGSANYTTAVKNFSGQIRLSDGHLVLTFWNAFDNAAADLIVYDITDAGTITAKTNVITDEAESICANVFINQVNDDIYITYFSGSAAQATVACFYQKSTDGGTNWGGETAMQADAEDDERWVSAGCMKAAWGGRFAPVWFNDDLNYLFCNADNSVSIAAPASQSLTNAPDSKAFGVVAASSTYYAKGSAPSNPISDGECTFTITNDSAGAEDIDIKCSNFTGGVGWTLASSTGENQVKITAYYSGQNPASGVVLTTSDQEFYDGLAGSATIKWDFRLDTGTFTDGAAKTATITLTAVAED
jgi:hypothetical protein